MFGDLENDNKLMSLLGTFWTRMYAGQDQVKTVLRARADLEQANYVFFEEALQSFSRTEAPVFRTRPWFMIVLNLSEADGNTWEIPSSLIAADGLYSSLKNPDRVLQLGLDFVLEDGSITFRENPFEVGGWTTYPVFDSQGLQSDTSLTVWVRNGRFDTKNVYRHWGYVLGIYEESSEEYKHMLNVLFDAATGGTAIEQVTRFYSILTGLPVARDHETVEAVYEQPDYTSIVTDKNVYRMKPGASVTVVPGDDLIPGDTMTSDLQFYEMHRGGLPDWVKVLAIDDGLLVGKYRSYLLFDNMELPVTVSEDESGNTAVKFPIGGFDYDVDKFWKAVKDRGLALGKSLAETLDNREDPDTQPMPENIPDLINPALFLADNVLRGNVLMVYVRAAQAQSPLGLHPIRFLRRIIPPDALVLGILEVSETKDKVILNAEGTTSIAVCPNPIVESLSMSDGRGLVYSLGTC